MLASLEKQRLEEPRDAGKVVARCRRAPSPDTRVMLSGLKCSREYDSRTLGSVDI